MIKYIPTIKSIDENLKFEMPIIFKPYIMVRYVIYQNEYLWQVAGNFGITKNNQHISLTPEYAVFLLHRPTIEIPYKGNVFILIHEDEIVGIRKI